MLVPALERQKGYEMLEEKTCAKCGANLKFDNYSKVFVCPFCGSIDEPQKTEVTLALVDEQISKEHFEKAEKNLAELLEKDPEDPRLQIRSLRCKLRSATVAKGLNTSHKIRSKVTEIQQYPEWDTLNEKLSAEKKPFVTTSRYYLEQSLKCIELKNKLARNKSSREAFKRLQEPDYSTATSPTTGVDKLASFIVALIFGCICLMISFICFLGENEDSEISNSLGFWAVFLGVVVCALIFVMVKVIPKMRQDRIDSAPRPVLSQNQTEDADKQYLSELFALEKNMEEQLAKIQKLEEEIG